MSDQQVLAGSPAARTRGITGSGRDFFSGVGFLLRGIGMYARSPKLMFLGLIPAVITGVLLVGAFVALIYFDKDIVNLITPYADNWPSGLKETIRVVAMVAIAAAWFLFSILAYTALTLVIGEPFYEAISKRVEDQLGGVAGEVDLSFWRTLPRSIVDSVRLLVISVIFGAVIFVVGFIPAAGQVLAPILGALLGGWTLALEVSSVPFERRGLRLRERRRMLKSRRFMSLGFGLATFACFLIPVVGAILVMPAAVAGATLLSRRLFGLPTKAPAP